MSDNRSLIGQIVYNQSKVQSLVVQPDTEALRRELEQLVAEAQAFVSAARSENTVRAYESDWAHFTEWCNAHCLSACPAAPETVALYLTALARSRKTSTLSRRLAAISHFHVRAKHPTPTDSVEVRTILSGIRRTKGIVAKRKKPFLGKSVVAAINTLPETNLLGLRNRALLLIGYAGALRRSELIALNWEDAIFTEGGLKLTIRQSKTDQVGKGSEVGIPFGAKEATCPVRALQAWKSESQLVDGPIFRVVGRAGKVMNERLSTKAVARLVKQLASALGLDPTEFSAHSLRAGLATTAATNGASERKIMDQTRHRSVNTVRVYIREAELFTDNAALRGGL